MTVYSNFIRIFMTLLKKCLRLVILLPLTLKKDFLVLNIQTSACFLNILCLNVLFMLRKIIKFRFLFRANVTCVDGYQWVGYKNEEDFPRSNAPQYCHVDVSIEGELSKLELVLFLFVYTKFIRSCKLFLDMT